MPEALDGSLVGRVATRDEALRRCVELAREALAHGDGPFGSVLVDGDGRVLAEDRNRDSSNDDPTYHPEIELARWAAGHLTPQQRARATMYTSGEHCAMCAAAHGWVGLGPIVTIATTDQFVEWNREAGGQPGPVLPLRINEVAPVVPVTGPVDGYSDQIRELYLEYVRAGGTESA